MRVFQYFRPRAEIHDVSDAPSGPRTEAPAGGEPDAALRQADDTGAISEHLTRRIIEGRLD